VGGLPQTDAGDQQAAARADLRGAGVAAAWPIAHRLAHWLQPAEAKAGSCGSGDGCSACGGCGSTASPAAEKQPLEFKSRSR
jgi:hypothetical protein